MANKMLIDASHPEETRVVVVRGSRIEEFDFESEHKKQLKGNIYLAKVTRVEPSLQAAFVEYGGNRHGFLAFSEIHPDYYQIPKADREALIAEELARAEEDDEPEEPRARSSRNRKPARAKAAERRGGGDRVSEAVDGDEAGHGASSDLDALQTGSSQDDARHDGDGAHGEADGDAAASGVSEASAVAEHGDVGPEADGDAAAAARAEASAERDAGMSFRRSDETDAEGRSSEESDDDSADDDEDSRDGETSDENEGRNRRGRRGRRPRGRSRSDDDDSHGDDNGDEAEEIDDLGSEDAMEEVPVRQARSRKQYKIQEVIKRRQILLVQVVKEERGNKGAALTTYLSLAGRYSVLMPNTARGGGISRKITNAADRKRLKDVVRDLDVPRGMGIILRTAGANRTKAEVKRDYEYLMRLWETVRNVTLSSIAPALVYEEGSLIKRSIRDLYNKDIDQILVAGEGGYREAKDFMRMLMPSQAKVVQPYRDPTPIFARQGIESQLDKMLQPHVTLKSGGYIIINQTEALVAIDVNSGRSTREHSIEDTAYQTNLEAAEEVARQLRLRDLAGLIVVDFIDMDEKRNNRSVEKKLKDCLKSDRARIQVGKISHFGLLEMSRQRIRASVLESTMQPCPICEGAGLIRSSSSLALHVLRTIEEHLQKHATHDLIVKVPTATALYVLNEKRKRIDELEHHYGLKIVIEADESAGHQAIAIERGAEALKPITHSEVVHPESVAAMDEADAVADEAAEAMADEEPQSVETSDGGDRDADDGGKRRRRRRRRRGGANASADAGEASDRASGSDEDDEDEDDAEDSGSESRDAQDDDGNRNRKRRRRGRRGGRRHREGDGDTRGGEQPAYAAAGDAETGGESQVSDHGHGDAAVTEVPAFSQDTQAEAAPAVAHEPAEAEAAVAAEVSEAPALETEPVVTEEPVTPQAVEPQPAFVSETPVEAEPAPAASEEQAAAPSGETAEAAANDDQPAEEVPAAAAAPKEPVVTSSLASDEEEAPQKPRRTGWWARRSFF